MNSDKVLEIVLREMTAYGRAWNINWSDFDGRTLRWDLNGIADWARWALEAPEATDYRAGSMFVMKRRGIYVKLEQSEPSVRRNNASDDNGRGSKDAPI